MSLPTEKDSASLETQLIESRLRELGTSESGLRYATQLYRQYLHPSDTTLDIGRTFLPSALLSAHERRETMGVVDYQTAIAGNPTYIDAARDIAFIATEMNAGLGSTIDRGEYVANIPHLKDRGFVGSKGSDVQHKPSGLHRTMSIMEIKAHRHHHNAPYYRSVALESLVDGIVYKHFLRMTVPTARLRNGNRMTYETYLSDSSHNMTLKDPIEQPDLPTVDKSTGKLTKERIAPGGHGHLPYMLFEHLAAHPPQDPQQIRVITNGEGVNDVASPEMVGFAAKEKAGIVLVTTTRTPADVKGGILGLSRNTESTYYTDIMEVAQAQTAGQEAVFQAMGLSQETHLLGKEHYTGEQYFNTNMALINEGLLGKFLSQLRGAVGEEEFARIITPDLIQNTKKQNGKEFIQLEGAMGSVLLRLNQYITTNPLAQELWKSVSGGSQFLRIINLDPTVRNEFFTPIKTSWDVQLQTSSDCFTLDTNNWRLRNNHQQRPIVVNPEFLASPYYKQLHNMLAAFGHPSLLGLGELTIQGQPVILPDSILRGKVIIRNDADYPVNLYDYPQIPRENGVLLLENIAIHITQAGKLEVEAVS